MRRSRISAFMIAAGCVFLGVVLFRYDPADSQLESIGARSQVPIDQAPLAELSQAPPAKLSQLNEPASVASLQGAARGSRRLPIGGPHGRVVETGTDQPIAGLAVQLTFGKKVLAETATARDGSFFLPEPERDRRTVAVISEKWRITPRKYRLDKDQTSGLAELLFEAERIVAAPLHGRIVDRKTGEPVPEFLFQARGPRGQVQKSAKEGDPDTSEPAVTFAFHSPPRKVESIVTGLDGRFESEGGFEAGLLDLVLVDHPSLLKKATGFPNEENSIEHQHTFDEPNTPVVAEVQIVIGPTYRLKVVLPSGMDVDDFYATFPKPSSGLRDMHRIVAGDPGSPLALFYRSALEQQALLRDGDPIWARFRHPVVDLQELSGDASDHLLHVRSQDGHWSGNAPVSSLGGIYPKVVPITLEAQGAIEGTVLDGKGKAIPTAWIQLADSFAQSPPVREVGADARGKFAFKWLMEGEYEVVVETDRYEQWRSTVSIKKGVTRRLEARLSAGVPLGTISGVLRSRTGQHRSKGAVVSLKSLDNPGFYLLKSVGYRKRKGEYTAAFSFDDVPSGIYELSLQPLDNLRWEALTMTVSPPAEGLEFTCEDDAPTFDLEFRAIDGQTGAPIEESWNIVWQGDPLEDVRLDDDWETGLYKAVPEGVSLQWVLGAEGYRLATGGDEDIRTEADHRVVEAKLERGWGQLFLVTTREGERIEGVELLADGDSVGVTDSQGMVSMNLDAKPRGLEFRYRDWIVTWGRIDPTEDGFGWGPETPVHMGRDR